MSEAASALSERRTRLQGALQPVQALWQQEWNRLQAAVPSRLYHYTTAAGLQGILQSQTLWATNSLYLNDSSELSYAVEIVRSVLVERMQGSACAAVAAFIE